MALPLEGIKILDLSTMLPGPFCSMILADFGAEVIKVEAVKGGDLFRGGVPKIGGQPQQKKHNLEPQKRRGQGNIL